MTTDNVSPVLWFWLLWVPKETSSTPTPSILPQQQMYTYIELMLYMHTTVEEFPRSPWKFKKQIR